MFVDTWEVLQPLTHLGRGYAKGDAISLDANTAFQLVAAGMVKKPELPAKVAFRVDAPPALPTFPPAPKGKG